MQAGKWTDNAECRFLQEGTGTFFGGCMRKGIYVFNERMEDEESKTYLSADENYLEKIKVNNN